MSKKRHAIVCLFLCGCFSLHAAEWDFTVTAANLYSKLYAPFDTQQEMGGTPVLDFIEFGWEERNSGIGFILSPCDMLFFPDFTVFFFNATAYWNILRNEKLILGPYIQASYLDPWEWQRFCVGGGIMLKFHEWCDIFGNENHYVNWTHIKVGIQLDEKGWSFTLGLGADIGALAKGFFAIIEMLAPLAPLIPDN